MHRSSKIFAIGLIIIALTATIGVAYIKLAKLDEEYKFPPPEEVVRQHFESWSKKNWPDMYATISDGFKKIDPYAKNLSAFREFESSQNISAITILDITEASNDGMTAAVRYSVEFVFANNTKSKAEGMFVLKYREGDIIRGWKIVNPYGNNTDMK